MSRWAGLAGLAVVLVAVGCGKSKDQAVPKTIAGCRDSAAAARDEAASARQAKDAAKASRAADRAGRCADEADRLLKQNPSPGEADKAALAETRAAAHQARRTAELAGEDARLSQMLGGLKARAYRTARPVAMKGLFASLALAAEQAGKRDLASLDKTVADAADLAAGLAGWFCGRGRLDDGKPDWNGIAADMKSLAGRQPPRMHEFISGAFVLAARTELALFEIEALDSTALTTSQEKLEYHLVRGIVLSSNDLPRLAVEQLEAAARAGGDDPGQSAPEIIGAAHFILAAVSLHGGDLERADVELARAMRVWPNNALNVFLTGERLAADGQPEEAARSLEKLAAGTENEDLAKAIAARARAIRDGQAGTRDHGFIRDVILYYALETGDRSPAILALRKRVDSARQFGRRLTEHLPKTGQ